MILQESQKQISFSIFSCNMGQFTELLVQFLFATALQME